MVAERDPIGNDKRRESKRRGLPDDAACAICGETDPVALRKIKGGRSVLEAHHVAGKANDPDLVVVLCLTHHRQQTSDQRGGGVELRRDSERSMPEKLVSVLRGLAVFFFALARACSGWADKLGALVGELDANYPAWRKLSTAQG